MVIAWRKTVVLKKQKAINATVRHVTEDAGNITDLKEISVYIGKFYKRLFKKNVFESDS